MHLFWLTSSALSRLGFISTLKTHNLNKLMRSAQRRALAEVLNSECESKKSILNRDDGDIDS